MPAPQLADQLALSLGDAPRTHWPCPTCNGTRRSVRRVDPEDALYRPGAETTAWLPCRPCRGTGVVLFDPDDFSVIPY